MASLFHFDRSKTVTKRIFPLFVDVQQSLRRECFVLFDFLRHQHGLHVCHAGKTSHHEEGRKESVTREKGELHFHCILMDTIDVLIHIVHPISNIDLDFVRVGGYGSNNNIAGPLCLLNLNSISLGIKSQS
jgi:hypothetical protein